MAYRSERINSEMSKSLTNIIINKIKDPRLSEMVSVTKVDVAKDLKTAKAYVSIYGDKDKVQSTFEALCRSSGFIRRELAQDFKDIRTIPEFTFILDTSMEYSQNINALLESIKKQESNQ